MTHICVGKLTIIDSDNGFSPGRHQAIMWNNAGLLLIEPLGTNFSEISIGIQTFFIQENALEHVVCEMASISSRPQCVNIYICTYRNLLTPIMHRVSIGWRNGLSPHSTKLLPEPMLTYCQLHPLEQSPMTSLPKHDRLIEEIMMTSSNGSIFRVTGHLCGEFPGHRWIPHTKVNNAEIWCFLWSTTE